MEFGGKEQSLHWVFDRKTIRLKESKVGDAKQDVLSRLTSLTSHLLFDHLLAPPPHHQILSFCLATTLSTGLAFGNIYTIVGICCKSRWHSLKPKKSIGMAMLAGSVDIRMGEISGVQPNIMAVMPASAASTVAPIP